MITKNTLRGVFCCPKLSNCDTISHMQITKTQKIMVGIVVILVLFAGYVYFYKKSHVVQNPTNNTTMVVATTTSGGTIITSGNGAYTITQVPITEGQGVPQPIPDLNRPVHPAGSTAVSTDALVEVTPHILALQTQLKKNPNDPQSWITLGIYQKFVGDYQGAVISWTYVTRLSPTNPVAYGDLADLYANFLKDNAKAEMYYKQAISVGPTQENLYIQFAQFYRDVGDSAKALAIVNQGLANIPNDTNLLQMKASLSK